MTDRPSVRRVPQYVAGFGVLLALGMLLEVIVAFTPVFPPDGVLPARIVTSVPFVGGLVYGGYWLARSDLPPGRYARIGWWSVGGLIGFLLVNAAVMLAVPPVNVLVAFGWVRWALSLGTSVGFLIGVFEARAIYREVISERARVRFERTETRRELLAYLDRLLADDVAPGMDAIADRATRLVEEGDLEGDAAADAAAIRRRARTLRALLGHARDLLDRDDGALGLEPVNLAAVLREELAAARSEAPDAAIEAGIDGDDEWYVLADRLLSRGFAELLAYLLDRNDRPTPRISLAVEPAPETVTVRITDNGPAIPAGERDGLFEYGTDPDAGDGSTLAFIGLLMEYYDGSIAIAETSPDGNVFVIELERVAVGPEAAPARGNSQTVPAG